MNHPNKIALAVLLAGLYANAFAGEGPAEESRPGSVTIQAGQIKVDNGNGVIKASGPGPFTITTVPKPRPIASAPYSAQMVTEHQQNLADGNQIIDRQTSMSYRDSAGRTRQENFDREGKPTTVTIEDPVAGARWVLNPREHSAVKLARGGQTMRISVDGDRTRLDPAQPEANRATIERRKREDGGEDFVIKRVQRADGDGRAEVRIETAQALAAQTAALRDAQTRLAPLTASAFGDMKWALHADAKKLGTREIEGVQADGWVRSYAIPAGAIGNRNPIVVADETWYARDLQITVYTKHSDPRSGDVEFRVEKLKREEPPAALFAVPADYTVRDLAAAAPDRGR